MTQAVDPEGAHASWNENFPWTRLPDVKVPEEGKPMIDLAAFRVAGPPSVRELLRDGSMGGRYARPDPDVETVWRTAVEEVRDLLQSGWLS